MSQVIYPAFWPGCFNVEKLRFLLLFSRITLKPDIIMLTDINPKLPMRDKAITKDFYLNKLGFEQFGSDEHEDYLMVKKDNIQIHFFEFKEIDPKENYGMVYIRTNDIEKWYQLALEQKVSIPTAGHLKIKPWRQKEFAVLDPDNNLLTFGESL